MGSYINIGRDYLFACNNGFSGSFGNYISHRVYCENKILKRCGMPTNDVQSVVNAIYQHKWNVYQGKVF